MSPLGLIIDFFYTLEMDTKINKKMHHQPCVKTIVMKWEIVEHNFSRDWTNNKSPTAVTMITYNVWHFIEMFNFGEIYMF